MTGETDRSGLHEVRIRYWTSQTLSYVSKRYQHSHRCLSYREVLSPFLCQSTTKRDNLISAIWLSVFFIRPAHITGLITCCPVLSDRVIEWFIMECCKLLSTRLLKKKKTQYKADDNLVPKVSHLTAWGERGKTLSPRSHQAVRWETLGTRLSRWRPISKPNENYATEKIVA